MTAMSVLYERHYNLMYYFGMKIIADENFIKDCIQYLFVKICVSRRLSPMEYVRSYLLIGLKRVMADRLEATRNTVDIDDMFDIELEDPEIEKIFERDDRNLQLTHLVVLAYRKLPSRQRIAIYLRYVRGMSYKEIAPVLGINVQSAMNQVNRAISSLRKHLNIDSSKS